MTEKEVEYMDYLTEKGILPKLLEILKQMSAMDPPPADPLMYILHALGCPLIPQAQMKALERKVSRAHDELRYLRRLLIDLDGEDQLYDSYSDDDEYVGAVEDPNESYDDYADEAAAQAQDEASGATADGSAQDQQELYNH
ncbi:uncharacterized protein [Drosophila kikkawai]|uniref:c-Myc-binding protein homolog n=1 Tax=Drosophila kikkawai TaxID=30033 RepID=A0A6P4IT12_DROKI|nr:uncharacterized protein LOC108077647 [Drosophila kikkawai]